MPESGPLGFVGIESAGFTQTTERHQLKPVSKMSTEGVNIYGSFQHKPMRTEGISTPMATTQHNQTSNS
jgi:hypothetical protein